MHNDVYLIQSFSFLIQSYDLYTLDIHISQYQTSLFLSCSPTLMFKETIGMFFQEAMKMWTTGSSHFRLLHISFYLFHDKAQTWLRAAKIKVDSQQMPPSFSLFVEHGEGTGRNWCYPNHLHPQISFWCLSTHFLRHSLSESWVVTTDMTSA